MSVIITSTTDSKEAVDAAMKGAEKPTESTESVAPVEAKADGAPVEEKVEGEVQSASPEEDVETDEGEAEGEGQKPKRNRGYKQKLEKAQSKLSAAEKERDYWRETALKGQKPEGDGKKEVEQKADSAPKGRPKAEDFATHEEYFEALAEYKAEQKFQERDAKQRELEVKAAEQKREAAHWQKVESFQKDHPDFAETIEDVDDIPMSLAVREGILSSEDGAKLMYELAKNRAEYERINRLAPLQAAIELGKFQAKIFSAKEAPTPEVPQTSKAPAPVTPVSGKAGSPSTRSIYDTDLSHSEWRKLREAGLKGARA